MQRTLPTDELIRRIWQHDAEYFGTFSQCTATDGYVVYTNPALSSRYDPNHIGYVRLSPGQLPAALAAFTAHFQQQQMDAVVYVDCAATPATLPAALVADGYTPMHDWGTVDLLVAGSEPPHPPAHRVSHGRDHLSRQQWAVIQDADPFSPPALMHALRRAEIADPRVDPWLVWDGPVPAGRCLTYIADGLGRIESVYVAAAHRRRGLAAALVSAALTHILQQGAIPYLFALHESDASRIYQRLRFTVAITDAVVTYVRPHGAS